MTDWIYWLLGASTVFAASLILLAWQGLRTSYTRLFLEVSGPWAASTGVSRAMASNPTVLCPSRADGFMDVLEEKIRGYRNVL